MTEDMRARRAEPNDEARLMEADENRARLTKRRVDGQLAPRPKRPASEIRVRSSRRLQVALLRREATIARQPPSRQGAGRLHPASHHAPMRLLRVSVSSPPGRSIVMPGRAGKAPSALRFGHVRFMSDHTDEW